MSIKSRLARLEELAHAKERRPVYKQVVWKTWEGPLTESQQRALAYNHSLKRPADCGFALITIDPQPRREPVLDEMSIQEASDLEN